MFVIVIRRYSIRQIWSWRSVDPGGPNVIRSIANRDRNGYQTCMWAARMEELETCGAAKPARRARARVYYPGTAVTPWVEACYKYRNGCEALGRAEGIEEPKRVYYPRVDYPVTVLTPARSHRNGLLERLAPGLLSVVTAWLEGPQLPPKWACGANPRILKLDSRVRPPVIIHSLLSPPDSKLVNYDRNVEVGGANGGAMKASSAAHPWDIERIGVVSLETKLAVRPSGGVRVQSSLPSSANTWKLSPSRIDTGNLFAFRCVAPQDHW
ncbi:hypothetical protein B0H19DRAFT_1084626 [Mycena capillaripes]|nr:hypothetical protein B0H19DRAFT_1084626 [Mycena capillaripes]